MEEYLEVALIECLDALEQGETVDQVLTRYPDLADQLRPMLETAVALPQINIQPSLAAQHRSRDAFLAQAAAMKDEKVVRPSPWLNLRRILMPIASLALVIILFAAGLGPLSANALPGDVLYGAKILVESARSALTLNPAADAALTEQFNQRRIQEVKTLLAENRAEDVSFTGDIEAVQPDSWTISGMAMQITAETQIFGGDPFVGQMAMVDGRTQDGSLSATTITLLPSNEPPPPTATPTATDLPTATPEPTETATPSPTFTYTPTPTSTPTDVPTATATATETPEPSPTITALPTNTPQPTPTNTPVSNDDGGSNDNSDSGDNSNDSNSNDNTNDNSDDNTDDNSNDNTNDNSDDNTNDNNENDNESNVNVNDNDGGHDDHSNTV